MTADCNHESSYPNNKQSDNKGILDDFATILIPPKRLQHFNAFHLDHLKFYSKPASP